MQLDTNRTVRELALEIPNATRVFEKFGIDYCCGGGKSLRDACTAAQISSDEVVNSLTADPTPGTETDHARLPLAELIDHIVAKHHGYVRQEVPRLKQLAAKVAGKHGERHPELRQIEQQFEQLGQELGAHMMKEEQILFPYIVRLEAASNAGAGAPRAMFGTVQNPIQMMLMEHDAAGGILKNLRSLSANFSAPEDACTSYKVLFQGLQEFELDLHQHIHLENNSLFPRSVELEQATPATR